ncbi:ATP-dependent zinc metalloprotease FtsH [Flaviaesturariibacter terrae]
MNNESSQQPGQNNTRKPKHRGRLLLYYGIIAATLLVLYLFGSGSEAPKQSSLNELSDLLQRGAVARIEVVNKERALVYLRAGYADSVAAKSSAKKSDRNAASSGPQYELTIGSVESLERRIDEIQKSRPAAERVELIYLHRDDTFWSIFNWILPLGLMLLAWRFLIRGAAAGQEKSWFGFNKSGAARVDGTTGVKVTFDDVAGLEEAETEVREIVDFLKSPGRFTQLGAKIPKGVILVGPPGTGKTLLARAVAGEAGVPFFSMSGSEFVEMFVGVGASRVRDLFRLAKQSTPSIVFIDEIDAIGRSRGKSALYTGSNDERESTLNQLLKEMDGFESNSGVIVLAATNRADMLDPALLRPGRFDRHIYLELPNRSEREAIFHVHLRPLKYDSAIDVATLAAQTPGFSGADIANVCNEAALIAARKKRDIISGTEFAEAIDRIVAGLEKKSKVISGNEKRVIAYHEAGHAVVGWFLPHIDPLIKVSIIPRGRSLGAAFYLPEERQLHTATEFREHLCAALGGRAAEELVFGEPTSGALDDLEKVTREAYTMIAFLGFSKRVGTLSFYDSTGQHENSFTRPYSEDTAKMIDDEVRLLLGEAYRNASELARQHREALDRLAGLLLQKETVYREELEAVLGKRPLPAGGPAG